MGRFFTFSLMAVLLLALAACTTKPVEPASAEFVMEHLSNYETPDTCFNKGVSAAYCGVSNGYLVLAGGCNFPHVPAAQGGEKIYYDYIWASSLSDGTKPNWKLVGRLPQVSAYGITLPYQNKLICVGGLATGGEKLNAVYALEVKEDQLSLDTLPSLPVCVDNAYGAIEGSMVYVVGGNADGQASGAVYKLDLGAENLAWVLETELPGAPRVQPVCAISHHALYIFGGYTPKIFENIPAFMPSNGMKYDLQTQTWDEVEAPLTPAGEIIALAGGAAVASPDGEQIICIGGVNQDIFPRALNGELSGPSYMENPVEWYKFNRYILAFQVETEQWQILSECEEGARAGASLVNDGTWNYIINGELKPGIRTPMISRFK